MAREYIMDQDIWLTWYLEMALDGAAIRSMSSLRASLGSRHVSAWLECDKARSSQVVWCSISGPQCIPWYRNISKPTDIYWDLLYLYNYIYIYLFISIDLYLGMNISSSCVPQKSSHHRETGNAGSCRGCWSLRGAKPGGLHCLLWLVHCLHNAGWDCTLLSRETLGQCGNRNL
jgi:hypothetical protein